MNLYEVTYEEREGNHYTYVRDFLVKAESEEEAMQKAIDSHPTLMQGEWEAHKVDFNENGVAQI